MCTSSRTEVVEVRTMIYKNCIIVVHKYADIINENDGQGDMILGWYWGYNVIDPFEGCVFADADRYDELEVDLIFPDAIADIEG